MYVYIARAPLRGAGVGQQPGPALKAPCVCGAPFLSVSLLLCYGDTPHFKSFSKRCVVTFSHNKPELLNAYFIFESTFKNIFAVSLHVPQRDPWAPRDTFRLLPAQAVTIETVAAKTTLGLGMW